MNMASLVTITVVLLCYSVSTLKGSSDKCETYGEVGRTVTVPLDYTLGSEDRLMWKQGQRTIFRKQAQRVVVGKKDDINGKGDLILKNLNKSFAGEYKAEVFNKNGELKQTKFKHVCVLDPVKKPTVKTECIEEKVNLTCMTDQRGVSYLWFQNGTQLEKEGSSLIKVPKEVQSDIFSCRVSNQVSSKNSDEVIIFFIAKCLESIIPNTLKVSPKALPSVVTEGSDITLSCHVTLKHNHPTNVSVTWLVRKDTTSEEILTFSSEGHEIAGKNYTSRYSNRDIRLAHGENGVFELVISKVKQSDGGTYKCTGKEWLYKSGVEPIKIRESTEEFGTVTITPPGFPEELFGISIWVFIGAGGGIVLMIILICVCCVRARRKRRSRQRAETENMQGTPMHPRDR